MCVAVGLAIATCAATQNSPSERKAHKTPPQKVPPSYRISFRSTEPLEGLTPAPVFGLPFQCTSDGTVYVGLLGPGPVIGPANLIDRSLASISTTGKVQRFSVAQIPDLQNIQEIDHYVSDTAVVFLVQAEKDRTRQTENNNSSPSGSPPAQASGSNQRDYIIVFDRKGELKSTVEIDREVRVFHVGIFPSGTFLVYGFNDAKEPKFAILDSSGALLKSFQLERNLTRKSALGTGPDPKGPKVYVAPVQFVSHGESIIAVQPQTELPLLQFSEGGAVTVIRPNLNSGARIRVLIPSDGKNLFIRVDDGRSRWIYEIDPDDGKAPRRFRTTDNPGDANVACVHEGQFLSFEHEEQGHSLVLVPLIGTPEIATDNRL